MSFCLPPVEQSNSAFSNSFLKPQHRSSPIHAFSVEVDGQIPTYLYVEESGNPKGIPVVFVHGGPGASFKPTDHQWFDPSKYRIILFQQRGTYRCVPSAGSLSTSASIFKDVGIEVLAKDIETLRKTLSVDQWLVFGGSWGSTLGLYYAENYPQSCIGLILRGIFLSTEQELEDFFTEDKISEKLPNWNKAALECLFTYAKQRGKEPLPRTMCGVYRQLIVEENDVKAARLWTAFEQYMENVEDRAQLARVLEDDLETTPEERTKGVWETQLIDYMIKHINLLDPQSKKLLKEIPIKVVHGLKDPICPPSVAQDLVALLESAGCSVSLSLIEEGEHSPYSHPRMIDALISATDNFANEKRF
jgi:proline iminopeptidase